MSRRNSSAFGLIGGIAFLTIILGAVIAPVQAAVDPVLKCRYKRAKVLLAQVKTSVICQYKCSLYGTDPTFDCVGCFNRAIQKCRDQLFKITSDPTPACQDQTVPNDNNTICGNADNAASDTWNDS